MSVGCIVLEMFFVSFELCALDAISMYCSARNLFMHHM